jgi:AcrR family transcriptional regulator
MEPKRLPRGRHGLTREFVRGNQRERVIGAVVESLHERGYEKTTATSIAQHAGVSKSDIYKVFASKDECFIAAYEDAVDRLRERVLNAANAASGGWAMQVAAGLRALLAFLAEDPSTANLLLVDGLRAGPETHERFQDAMRSFVPYLRQGWSAPEKESQPPEAVDEAVVGGIVSLLCRRAQSGETEQLEEFFPEIAEFVLSPYLGPSKTRRIISAA